MSLDYIVITCPHCKDYIFVYLKEFNCKIFRHGVYKDSLKQINPHLPKKDCDKLKDNDLILGCGKPFKLIQKDDKIIAEKCDYI